MADKQQAEGFLSEARREHYNASHYCYACAYEYPERQIKYSDDGEPTGTAAKPILETIAANDLVHACLIVVRYFGGTLLGTGGLQRAYRTAAEMAVKAAVSRELQPGVLLSADTDYQGVFALQSAAAASNGTILDIQYTDTVSARILLAESMVHAFTVKFADITNGQGRTAETGHVFYTENAGAKQIVEFIDL